MAQIDFWKGRLLRYFKDTNREKAPSNKIPTLTKSTNMGIWVIGTSNEPLV